MNLQYLEEERIFRLDTPGTSYLIGIVGEEGFLGHIYYGGRLADLSGIKTLLRTEEAPYTPDTNDKERISFLDSFPMEYSFHGVGDYRESCVRVRDAAGAGAVCLTYVKHEIFRGKEKLPGLPAVFGGQDDVMSLAITCEDKVLGLRAVLKYSVFADTDAIAKSVCFTNLGEKPLYLEKALSGCLDMDNREFDVLTLHGSWGRERHMERKKLGHGKFKVSSLRDGNCHQEHPFLALLSPGADQDAGEVYGFHFVYSGNFMAQAEVNQFDSVRVVMGIEPEDFCWKLEPGESFQTPEMITVYSEKGLSGMTKSLHTLYRKHLIRSPYLHKRRPILINNWEGTYFDFNEEKLIEIARQSAALGIEMLVMDDGWFGDRCDDSRSLGDWQVNQEKLKGGLPYLVEQVKALGMQFGIWFEPEMISPDSRLYREHPDWAIAIPGRRPGMARNQYVLDLSRKEVRDHIMEEMFDILHSADIAYVKWDMNRPLTDLHSAALAPDRQGELAHRFVLGMYEMQERLLAEFPGLLLENCSSGGGRFDPGMLYYSPQIWCSDDTDAVERLAIQESTAMLYPLSTIGAHVSVCPNHAVGRNTPLETRGFVALAGTFGYELDITKLTEEEKELVSRQTRLYGSLCELIREGDYYRLASYQENHSYDCFQVNAADGGQALVFYTQVLNETNRKARFIPLRGLLEEARYALYQADIKTEELFVYTNRIFSGSVLMKAGLPVERMWGDFQGRLLYLKKI